VVGRHRHVQAAANYEYQSISLTWLPCSWLYVLLTHMTVFWELFTPCWSGIALGDLRADQRRFVHGASPCSWA